MGNMDKQSAYSRVADVAEPQGWSEDTVLDLAFTFFDQNPELLDSFIEYLEGVAENEQEMSECSCEDCDGCDDEEAEIGCDCVDCTCDEDPDLDEDEDE